MSLNDSDETQPISFIARAEESIESLPEWARPPFYGVFIVYYYMAMKALFAIPILFVVVLRSDADGLLKAGWVVIVAGLAGFCGGLAYALVAPLSRSLGKVGRYGIWWLTVGTYLFIAFVMLGNLDASRGSALGPLSIRVWVLLAIVSVVFGSGLAHTFAPGASAGRRQWTRRSRK
jgi:hypothetical protein